MVHKFHHAMQEHFGCNDYFVQYTSWVNKWVVQRLQIGPVMLSEALLCLKCNIFVIVMTHDKLTVLPLTLKIALQ
uniref:Mads2 n=1 Tax=Arundo donax TaxID=35708 RepID=A0A0A9F2M7_ARUDO